MEKNIHFEEKGFFTRYHISLVYLLNKKYNEIKKDELKKTLYFLICYEKDERENSL